ncbi:hypothetical protein [Bacillus sp. FJAT-18017]|uniref:hypothetical protein n=1 Tax=Bacillus sp. FJAT-18017 TaxID=1705566 RepID=UPI0012E28D07|nr:hypothetical protein [Bacillus sp. FJAT-18017]
MDFVWDEPDLIYLAAIWRENQSVLNMAKHFKRDPDEIILALIHLAREKEIKRRPSGLKGDGHGIH